MKRVAAVALVLSGLMIPACAQRGGSRGGSGGGFSGGRGSVGFHSSAMPSTRFSYASTPMYSGYRGGMGSSYRVNAPAGFGRRPLGSEGERRRGVYGPYVGAVVPWIYTVPYEYGDITTDVPGQDANVVGQGYEGQPGDPGQQEPAPVYQAYNEPPPPPARVKAPEPEDAVTLVFKDGRPPEQIHNYILSRTTLYVRDGRKQDIPVSDLDLAATEKANRDAGVEFSLPSPTK